MAAAAAPATSAACSGQFQAVLVSVVEAVVGLERLVANHPSVAVVASCRGIPEAAPYLVVVVASVPVDPVARAECPFQVVESVWVAFGLVAVADCCRPSTALTAECWAAW